MHRARVQYHSAKYDICGKFLHLRDHGSRLDADKIARKSCERGPTEPSSFIATPNTPEKPSIPARFTKGQRASGRIRR